jgi:hypothetical protein
MKLRYLFLSASPRAEPENQLGRTEEALSVYDMLLHPQMIVWGAISSQTSVNIWGAGQWQII